MEEIWKDIVGYKEFYQISNMGNVRSKDRYYDAKYLKHNPVVCRKGVKLKPQILKDGYLGVCLYKHGKGKTFSIHKLVASMFIDNILNKPCIDHINGNRTDNRADNLRWVTAKENQNNPITRSRLSDCKIGNKHPLYGKKLSKEHVEKIANANRNGKCSIPIVQLSCELNLVKEYPSTNEASRQTGISHGNIWRAIKKHQKAGGYKWAYKKDYNQRSG